MCLAVLWVILGMFYGVEFDDILTTSIILTGFSLVIGDFLILPRFENMSATIADFFLSFLVILAMGSLLFEGPMPLLTASLISALVLAIGELVFHQYMNNRVLDHEQPTEENRSKLDRRYLQTEFGEEMDPDDKNDRERKE